MDNQNQQPKTDREILEEIQEISRKTKSYMKWQLIITVVLIVIPLLITIIAIPFALRSVTSLYSGYGLDSLTSGRASNANANLTDKAQDIINQYTK